MCPWFTKEYDAINIRFFHWYFVRFHEFTNRISSNSGFISNSVSVMSLLCFSKADSFSFFTEAFYSKLPFYVHHFEDDVLLNLDRWNRAFCVGEMEEEVSRGRDSRPRRPLRVPPRPQYRPPLSSSTSSRTPRRDMTSLGAVRSLKSSGPQSSDGQHGWRVWAMYTETRAGYNMLYRPKGRKRYPLTIYNGFRSKSFRMKMHRQCLLLYHRHEAKSLQKNATGLEICVWLRYVCWVFGLLVVGMWRRRKFNGAWWCLGWNIGSCMRKRHGAFKMDELDQWMNGCEQR